LDVAIDDLMRLPEERRRAIQTATATSDPTMVISSAKPLTPSQRDSLTKSIESLLGRPLQAEWREDTQLLAGVRISLGSWVLAANLQDELKFFAESLRAEIQHEA
ncbi:MAG TPA: F0F1 ATP synthase subunit delta, partial [Nitrospira sp.]|nr:F0F1 ATP synthase subunit delta [Nitrospira sp.]